MTNFSGWDFRKEQKLLPDLVASSVDLVAPVKGLFAAPAAVDLTGVLPIEYQGGVPSCQGHDLSTCLEVCGYHQTGEMRQLSRAYAYYGTQSIDGLLGQRGPGSTISGVVKLATKYGICPEEAWPYREVYDPNPPGGWDAVQKAAAPFKIRSHTQIRSYDDAKTFLGAKLGAITIGIIWNGYCAAADGYIYDYREVGEEGHAVCVCGYLDEVDADGRKTLVIANSHGRRYGRNGFAFVKPRAFDRMIAGQFTVAFGLSDLTVETAQARFSDRNVF